MQITLGQQYIVEEKPTLILYIYINRHAGNKGCQTFRREHRHCKDKNSSWHLIGFFHGISIGSTVQYGGEIHCYTVHLHQSLCRYTKTEAKSHEEPGYNSVMLYLRQSIGFGIGLEYCRKYYCSHKFDQAPETSLENSSKHPRKCILAYRASCNCCVLVSLHGD